MPVSESNRKIDHEGAIWYNCSKSLLLTLFPEVMLMWAPTVTISPELLRAASRASELRSRGLSPSQLEPNVYAVPSAHTTERYVVRIVDLDNLKATCSCPHGLIPDAKGTCWHVGAAMLAAIASTPRARRAAPRG
jgi:hypothetical protein